jgi:hypothetical protein
MIAMPFAYQRWAILTDTKVKSALDMVPPFLIVVLGLADILQAYRAKSVDYFQHVGKGDDFPALACSHKRMVGDEVYQSRAKPDIAFTLSQHLEVIKRNTRLVGYFVIDADAFISDWIITNPRTDA